MKPSPSPPRRRPPNLAELRHRRDLLLARGALDRSQLALQVHALDQDLSQRLTRAGHWLSIARRAGMLVGVALPALLISRAGRRGLSQGAQGGARLGGRLLRALPTMLPLALRLTPLLLRLWRRARPPQGGHDEPLGPEPSTPPTPRP